MTYVYLKCFVMLRSRECPSSSSCMLPSHITLFNVSDNPRSNPGVWVLPLVPIDEALPPCNPRVRGPAATKNNVVLSIKKVSRVARVQLHRLESLVLGEVGGGPLPDAAHVTLTAKLVAEVGDGHGVPIVEGCICVRQIDEQ